MAHLGEVEERRLHLQAAHGSLFSYCVHRLGMSEDEACRRIEVARLARRFPALFAELADGSITLSVALLLKRVLSADNHLELIAAVRGASSQRASEILAARFPRPDVPSGIRKLPERRGAACNSMAAPLPALASASVAATMPSPRASRALASASVAAPLVASMSQPVPPTSNSAPGAAASAPPRQRIEPLSAGRYRVQFTADASVKRKLEQARDLLRHAQPNGDLGEIVSRALDSLLDELMGRRFGARKERAAKRAPHARATAAKPAATPTPGASPTTTTAGATAATTATAITASRPAAAATMASPPAAAAARSRPAPLAGLSRPASRSARAARRAVLERDGLGCRWVDGDGQRCGSSAWLELDHRHPAGKGGSAEPDNLRLLCRAHNRFAAERAYGRDHIERAIRARRRLAEPAPATPRRP